MSESSEPAMAAAATVSSPGAALRPGSRAAVANGARRLIAASAAACLCSVAGARADQSAGHAFLTADQLLAMCSVSGYSPANPSPAAMLYLMGVVDSEALAPARSQDPIFCVPDGTGQSAMAKVVCRYVDDHAESRNYTAVSLTYAALRSRFPCR